MFVMQTEAAHHVLKHLGLVCLFVLVLAEKNWANDCADIFSSSRLEIFSQKKQSRVFGKATEPFSWASIDAQVIDSFKANLLEGRYLPEFSSHARVLRDVFGISQDKINLFPPPKEIVSRYNKEIDRLVNKGIVQESNTLRPAMVVFRKLGSVYEVRWVQWGEPVPKDFLPVTIVWEPVFHRMLAEGFYPISSAEKTPTFITGFEHDLAHLTSFIEAPDFMSLTRAYSESQTLEKKHIFSSEELTASSSINLGYFIAEGLEIIRPQQRARLVANLLLPENLRKNPSSASLESILSYLETLPYELVKERLGELIANESRFVFSLGGSNREWSSRYQYPVHNLRGEIRSKFLWERKNDLADFSLEDAARYQLALVRLADTTLEGWFDALKTGRVSMGSPEQVFLSGDNLFQVPIIDSFF